jgi:hypothetical protein
MNHQQLQVLIGVQQNASFINLQWSYIGMCISRTATRK